MRKKSKIAKKYGKGQPSAEIMKMGEALAQKGYRLGGAPSKFNVSDFGKPDGSGRGIQSYTNAKITYDSGQNLRKSPEGLMSKEQSEIMRDQLAFGLMSNKERRAFVKSQRLKRKNK